jgi:hypothetical protein
MQFVFSTFSGEVQYSTVCEQVESASTSEFVNCSTRNTMDAPEVSVSGVNVIAFAISNTGYIKLSLMYEVTSQSVAQARKSRVSIVSE